MIRISVKPVSEAILIEKIRGRTDAFIDREARVLGESMVRETVAIIDQEFNIGDPDHRKPGPHLRESFTYEIDTSSPRGATVRLTTKAGVNAKKVAALEYGAKRDYEITPSGAVFGTQGASVGRTRARRLTNLGFQGRPTQLLRFPDPLTGEDVYARSVTHKAFEGKHFMRRGVEAALEKMRARSARRR